MSQRTVSKLGPATMSSATISSSQRDSASASWSPQNGMNSIRLMSQPKVRSKRKPVLPGGKLQPLFKNNAASPKPRNVQNSEHFPVLPHISCDVQRNGADRDIFSGVLTDLPESQPSDVTIYLCYSLTEMRAEVDALMATAVPQLQLFCADLGLAFQLVDPNWRQRGRLPAEVHKFRSNHPNRILTECQRSSLGPNFLLLMGETFGRPMIVSEIAKTEFATLNDVISRNSIVNGPLLNDCYLRDDNADPPAFRIKASPESEVDFDDLIRLLQLASAAARDEGKLTDDDIKKYFTSALEEDVRTGVIGIQSPRTSCLAYRRELQTPSSNAESTPTRTAASQVDKGCALQRGQLKGQIEGGIVTSDEQCQGRAQSLWKDVEQYLSSTNSRNYFVRSASDGDEAFRKYLGDLWTDFVADVKELVLQRHSSRAVPSAETTARLEVLHHSRICERKSRSYHGQGDLLEAVRNFFRDPSRNSQPFIVHGPPGSGKSAAVASAARACRDWFSGDCVTVVRFLGTSAASGNIHDTVTSIAIQVCLAYGFEIPDEVEGFGTLYKALNTFRATLDSVSKERAFSRPLIVFLDGIDQLRPYSECLEALWAVKNLPPNVHVVLSSVKENGSADFFGALVTLLTSPGCMAEVRPIGAEDANDFVQDHLRGKQRKLSKEQLRMVLSSAADANYLPLYLNIIAREAAGWESTLSDPVLPSSPSDALVSLLDGLEREFGKSTVRYFVSYLTVSQVGILVEEMVDLLSSNRETAQEIHSLGILSQGGLAAMIMSLKDRLEEFVGDRLVFGRRGFGWTHGDFRRTAAERYNIIVDGASEEQLREDMANFTLLLHEHFANIYLAKEDRSNRLSDPLVSSTSEQTVTVVPECSSDLVLSVDDAVKSNRLAHHLRVLLPIEGLARIKKCLVFNFQWLQSRLACSGLRNTILRDVLSVLNLSRHLINESVVEDTCADIEVVYEFIQLTLGHVSKDPGALAIEILGRLREISQLHTGVAQLVGQAEEWLGKTERRMLVPLRSVWAPPGSLIRHTLPGPSQFLGYLRDGEVAVLFSESRREVDVWRLQTGELLHRFGVCREQTVEGILTGHSAEFVVLTHYSYVNRLTGFDVWSTETGIRLISSTFQRQFEALALDEDDQLMAVATLVQSDLEVEDGQQKQITTKDLERCILGIAVLTKEVAFRLPTGDLHAEGVGRLIFVHNVRRETNSIVSIGRSPSQDLGFWDLDAGALDFSLDLCCTPNIVRLNADHKVIVCACSAKGMIVVVNLARGTINHRVEAPYCRDLTDIVTRGDAIFVASPTSGVVCLSISQSALVRVVEDAPPQAIPTKLLVTGAKSDGNVLFVGYDTGMIRILDVSSPDAATERGTLSGHKGRVNSLSLTRSDQLLSAADDESAIVWNYRSLQLLLEEEDRSPGGVVEDVGDVAVAMAVEGGDDDIGCFVVTSDEQSVITGSRSGSIRVWNIRSGELMKTLPDTGDNGIDHLSLARDEQLLIGHCTLEQQPNIRVLRVWDLEKSEIVQLEGEGDHVMIYCSAVTPSGDRLVSIRPCKDNVQIGIILGIYDLTRMKSLSHLICNIYGSMDARNLRIVGFSSRSVTQKPETMATDAGKAAAAHSKEKSIRHLFLVLNYFPKIDVSYFFTFTISGDRLDDISMDSHDPVHVDTANPDCSVLGPNEVCVTGSVEGQLVRWNVRTQAVEGHFVDQSTRNGRKEEPTTGQRMRSTKGQRNRSTTGQRKRSTTGRKKEESTMDRKKEELAVSRFAHEGPVTCVAVDFQRGFVVSGGRDRKVKVWSLSSRDLVTTFTGHKDTILCVSTCVEPSLVVSTSADGTLCVLKLGRSDEKLCGFPSRGDVRSVVMTTDGQRVAALLRTTAGSQLLLLRSVNF